MRYIHRVDSTAVAEERSFRLLWWIPLSPIVGFVVASWLLSVDWPLWQVAPLALALAAPFGLGAYYGFVAVLGGSRRAWISLVLHAGFTAVAVVMPVREALNA